MDRCDIDESIEQLAADFRNKRSIAGHFSGGPWNPEVDQWMGRKHKLMIELGLRLGAGGCRKSQVNSLLGPPDQIARKGDRFFNLIMKLPDYSGSTAVADEFMVYFWRGNHDFLFFASHDGVIINSDWWHAGD